VIGFVLMLRADIRDFDRPDWIPRPREDLDCQPLYFYPLTRLYYRRLDEATAAGLRMGPP
jgi:hypothetical protein